MKKLWQRLKGFLFLLVGAVNVGLFVVLCYRWFSSAAPDTPSMTRGDYLDLSLSLLSVLLTVVTIFLAIAAFFAYYDLRNAAERMAERTTVSVFQKIAQQGYLEHEGQRITLESAISSHTSGGATPNPHEIGDGATKQEEGRDV